MAIPARTSLFGHSTCTCMPVSVSIFVSCQLPLWPSSLPAATVTPGATTAMGAKKTMKSGAKDSKLTKAEPKAEAKTSGPWLPHRRPPHPEVPRVHQLPNFSPQGLHPDPLYPVRHPLAPEPATGRPGLAMVKPPRPGRQHPEARAPSLCHRPPGGFFLKATGHSAMLRGKKVGLHFSMFSPQVHCLHLGFRDLLGLTGLGWRV